MTDGGVRGRARSCAIMTHVFRAEKTPPYAVAVAEKTRVAHVSVWRLYGGPEVSRPFRARPSIAASFRFGGRTELSFACRANAKQYYIPEPNGRVIEFRNMTASSRSFQIDDAHRRGRTSYLLWFFFSFFLLSFPPPIPIEIRLYTYTFSRSRKDQVTYEITLIYPFSLRPSTTSQSSWKTVNYDKWEGYFYSCHILYNISQSSGQLITKHT